MVKTSFFGMRVGFWEGEFFFGFVPIPRFGALLHNITQFWLRMTKSGKSGANIKNRKTSKNPTLMLKMI